jgi:hypothetical protein
MNVAVCTELQVADVVWILEPNMREVRSDLRNFMKKRFVICILRQKFGCYNQGR